MRQHAAKHSKEYYYEIRSQHDLDDRIEIAARFIYLNKTCYNGLWRVNSKGEFNVPIGSARKPAICDEDNLRACHVALQGSEILMHDFLGAKAGAGDLVYFDPPYHPLQSTPSFTSYTIRGFRQQDQTALRDRCLQLHERGAHLMLSNSDTPFIRELYGGRSFHMSVVQAPRAVNSKADGRGVVHELLITNY